MAINGRDFLDSSLQCLEYECEAGFRNAVSRAYYSMFHKAHEELKNIPHCNNNHHANLIRYMRGELGKPEERTSAPRLKILGYELRQMRQARNESDYKLTETTVNKNVAIESIEIAKHFFDRISS